MWHRIHNVPAGRWLHKCPDAVGGLPPKLAAASLVLTGANYEGLAPAPKGGRPPVLLAELSEHLGIRTRRSSGHGVALQRIWRRRSAPKDTKQADLLSMLLRRPPGAETKHTLLGAAEQKHMPASAGRSLSVALVAISDP